MIFKWDAGSMEFLIKSRSMSTDLIDDLPYAGYVAVDANGQPVCAGFVRMIEGNYAMFDSFISDPNADRELRAQGFDLIVKKLEEDCKAVGVKKLLMFTKSSSIKRLALAHSFIMFDHEIGIKGL